MRTTLPWLIENLQSQSPDGRTEGERVGEERCAEREREGVSESFSHISILERIQKNAPKSSRLHLQRNLSVFVGTWTICSLRGFPNPIGGGVTRLGQAVWLPVHRMSV